MVRVINEEEIPSLIEKVAIEREWEREREMCQIPGLLQEYKEVMDRIRRNWRCGDVAMFVKWEGNDSLPERWGWICCWGKDRQNLMANTSEVTTNSVIDLVIDVSFFAQKWSLRLDEHDPSN